MAQHYIVDLHKEERVKKSLTRIGRYLAKDWNRKKLEREACMNKWLLIYGKEVLPFSNAYAKEVCEFENIKPDEHFYIAIKSYSLEEDLEGFEEDAMLEVLFDKTGAPVRVYFPL